MHKRFKVDNIKYYIWLIEHRIIVVMISLLLTGIAVSGIQFLGLSTDYRAFFSAHNPQLIAFESLQDTFSKDDSILLVLKTKEGSVFTAKTLSSIEQLTETAWKIPYTRRVDSITNFQHSSAEGDELVVGNLVVDAMRLTTEELTQVKTIALAEPRLLNRIISPDGSTTAVNVTLQLPGKSREEIPKAVTAARKLAAEIGQQHPEIELHLTGNVMLNSAMSEASIYDIKTLVPVMYGIIIITVLLLLRSLTATLAMLAIVGLSTITAIGLAGWAGIIITPPSASAPTIIMTLAVADSIHIITSFLAALRSGQPKKEAIKESMRINMEPVFLTSLTTAIGFLSMNFVDVPPLRDLGNIATMGIVAAFLYTIFLLPALLSWMPAANTQVKKSSSEKILTGLCNIVIRHYRFLFITVFIISVSIIVFIPNLKLNDQYINYFDEDTPFRVDTDFTMNNLTGIYKIEYILPSNKSGGISEPEYLNSIEKFSIWYKNQPEVVHVSSIIDTMKQLNQNMHGDDPAAYHLPDSRELAAQYLLLYEMSLPYGLDLNTQISVDKDSTRFSVIVKNIPTEELLILETRAQQWLHNNVPKSMITDGTGTSIIFAHMSGSSIRSMIGGTILAMLLIGGILMIALKSYKYGFISFLPNMLPALIAMGIWAITVGELGFALSVMIAMTIGIVVDDTIHFLSKYLRARREMNLNSEEAVRYAFSSVGFAMLTTTLVLVLGFLVLSQSRFLPNSGMAMLTTITLCAALIIDLLLVPALLIWLERKPEAGLLLSHPDKY